MDVRMPDGTIVKNVPEGTTKQQLLQKLGQVPAPEAAAPQPQQQPMPALDDPGFLQAVGRQALVHILGNAANTPMVAAETMAGSGGIMGLTPDPRRSPLMKGVGSLVETATGFNPMSGLGPAPTMPDVRIAGEDVLAAGQTAAQLPGAVATGQPLNIVDRFGAAQTEQQATSANFAEQAPVGTAVGGAAGDIATILTGRLPVRALGKGAELAQIAPKVAQVAPTVLGKALQGFARTMGKSAGRALETGAEGAFLASLQNADIAQVAAGGAAAQMVGDVGLATFRKFSQPKTLLTALALGTVGSLGLQQLTPGGLNRVLPTFEARTKEAVIAFLLSGSATALVGGRVPKNFAGPAFAELVDVTRRGSLLSMLTSLSRDPARTAPVVQKFTEDPDYFGPKAKRLLTRAINSEKIDVRNTVDHLMKDRGFRKQFDALSGTQ